MGMNSSSTNDILDKALALWGSAAGDGSTKLGISLAQWELRNRIEEVNAAREMDASGLTGIMLLRDTLQEHLQTMKVCAFDYITAPESVRTALAPYTELWRLLNAPSVLEDIQGFRDAVLAGCDYYGMSPDEDFLSWLSDNGLANLRAGALRSMDRLEVYQFAQGQGNDRPLRYNRVVVEFWNVNSLLRSLRDPGSEGITLALIRDPEVALHSFFVVAVKNGENITLLTDRAKDPHPDFKRLGRRLDRVFDQRWGSNWFPYELIDVVVSDDGKRLRAEARTGLVPINVESVKLVDLVELHPASVVWLMLLFQLIQQRYGGRQPLLLEDLSYTGEMVRDPHVLIEAGSALVLNGTYKPLVLPDLTREDMVDPQAGYVDFGERYRDLDNNWMIERYGDKVPEELLNIVGAHERRVLLPLVEQGDLVRPERSWGCRGDADANALQVGAFDPVDFGTREHIEQNRVWEAHKSQCAVIQRLAVREFQEAREEMLSWFTKRIQARAEVFLNALAAGEFMLPHQKDASWAISDVAPENRLRLADSDMWNTRSGDVRLYTGYMHKARCPDTFAIATIFGRITPVCPEALAVLCGCEVAELPWALRHWRAYKRYTGNHLLQRVDQRNWRLANPWSPSTHGTNGPKFIIDIALSKRAIAARRKAMGLPPKTLVLEKSRD